MQAIVLEADWDPRPGSPLSAGQLAARKAPGSMAWRNPRYARRELADPTPAHGQVVVAVAACGVCGSDTHCHETDGDGYILFSGTVRLPVVPGHEYTGEVVAVGPGVRGLAVGDLVAAEGMLNCGVCETCRVGQPNQCPDLEMVGFSAPGAYADYIAVEERFCWKLDGLVEALGDRSRALEIGALVEPISCSYTGIWVSGKGLRPGDEVVVWGCGAIGLGAVALARAAGAARVIALDSSPERVALAAQLGADAAFDVGMLARDGASPAETILELTRGRGADLHVEAAGAALKTLPEIERSMAAGGQMVYLGRTGEHVPVMLDDLVTGASSIVGSRGHVGGGSFRRVIRLLEQGRLSVDAMITSRLRFPDVIEALGRSCDRADGKIMMRYGAG